MIAHRLPLALILTLGCWSSKPAPAPPSSARPVEVRAGAARPAGCMAVPWQDEFGGGEATYRGTLVVVQEDLGDGRVEHPYILQLDQPACLPAGGEAKETDEVQVFSTDDSKYAQLHALVGKRIVVVGGAMLAHTIHHHRPLLVDAKTVSAQ